MRNPPAFPRPKSTEDHRDLPEEGMTLRDWFAGQALAGFNDHSMIEQNAAYAYKIADAMLKEREK